MDGIAPVSSHLCHPKNRKRTHNQISRDSSSLSPSWATTDTALIDLPYPPLPALPASDFSLHGLRMPSSRFRGDGLDMRRPVLSTQSVRDVIDLTRESPTNTSNTAQTVQPPRHGPQEERSQDESSRRPPAQAQRGPRYHRPIIDTDTAADTTNTVDLRDSSPEVQFIRERPRSRSRNNRGQNHGQPEPPERFSVTPGFPMRRGANFGIDLNSRHRPPISLPDLQRLLPPFARLFGPGEELVAIDDWDVRDFDINMNVNMQGFNLQNPSAPVQQPRLPMYEAPSAPREGFTRDLKEDDILVCPNCDDELGTGDNDVKRQVWIVKTCGHVYCGECAKLRTSNKKPTARKGAPFKKCVVETCGKPVHARNIIQVYL